MGVVATSHHSSCTLWIDCTSWSQHERHMRGQGRIPVRVVVGLS
uniref:Uncharacterized protein n=1 Tax=Arundo donax TaxID=35708 RepID=A0A0A8YQZ0_ARUDO